MTGEEGGREHQYQYQQQQPQLSKVGEPAELGWTDGGVGNGRTGISSVVLGAGAGAGAWGSLGRPAVAGARAPRTASARSGEAASAYRWGMCQCSVQ